MTVVLPSAEDPVVRGATEAVGGPPGRHALLGEAVYDDLLPGERVRLHAAYVDALREGRARGTAAELARHARLALDLGVAAITNVQLDHEAILGPTLAAIGGEKAPIIKSGDVAVTGAAGRGLRPILDRAAALDVPLLRELAAVGQRKVPALTSANSLDIAATMAGSLSWSRV